MELIEASPAQYNQDLAPHPQSGAKSLSLNRYPLRLRCQALGHLSTANDTVA